MSPFVATDKYWIYLCLLGRTAEAFTWMSNMSFSCHLDSKWNDSTRNRRFGKWGDSGQGLAGSYLIHHRITGTGPTLPSLWARSHGNFLKGLLAGWCRADIGGLGVGWGHSSWLPHLYLSVGFFAQMVFLTQNTAWPAVSLLPQSASPWQESPFWLQLLKVPGMGWGSVPKSTRCFPLTKQET